MFWSLKESLYFGFKRFYHKIFDRWNITNYNTNFNNCKYTDLAASKSHNHTDLADVKL